MMHDKLKELRRRAGLSQAAFAELIGETRENYNSIENNRRPITEKLLRKVAAVPKINITLEQLLFWQAKFKAPNLGLFGDSLRLKVRGTIAAGALTDNGLECVQGYVNVPNTKPFSPDCFALKVKGDSMSPMIPDGALAVCRPADTATMGKLYVVQCQDGGATLKMVVADKVTGKPYLKPINKKYPPIQLDDDGLYHCFEMVAHFNDYEVEPLDNG
jgi:repressor LexA